MITHLHRVFPSSTRHHLNSALMTPCPSLSKVVTAATSVRDSRYSLTAHDPYSTDAIANDVHSKSAFSPIPSSAFWLPRTLRVFLAWLVLRCLLSSPRMFCEGSKTTHGAQEAITHHSDQARRHRPDTDDALAAH